MNLIVRQAASDEKIATTIRELDRAVEAHDDWVEAWHRSMLCGLPFPADQCRPRAYRGCELGRWCRKNRKGFLDDREELLGIKNPHEELHARACELAVRATKGEEITPEEYGEFQARERELAAQLRRVRDGLRDALSARDPLTRTLNRESFELVASREIARSARTGDQWCIAIADLDYFKLVNDTHGHQAGDLVLRTVARRLTANLRPYDSLCRYGGDEFVLFLPGTAPSKAVSILERLRNRVWRIRLALSGGGDVEGISLSFGLAGSLRGMSLDEGVARADEALYVAKREGRNRVHVWCDEDRDRENDLVCYSKVSHEYGDR